MDAARLAKVKRIHSGIVHERFLQVAQVFNDLRDLGITNVSARHGAVMSDFGYVLQNEDGSWSVRMKIYDPEYSPVGDADDD